MSVSLSTRASESAGPTNALLELLDFDHLGGVDALEDELGNAVAFLDGEVDVAVVEQEYLDLSAVVGVDDARSGVDKVLGGEAGARGDTAVYFCTENRSEKVHMTRGEFGVINGFFTYMSQRERPC